MSNFWLHPALLFFLGAAVLPLLPQGARKGWLLLIPILAFVRTLLMAQGTFGDVHFLQWTLTFGRVDKLSLVFGHIMALMAILGTLYGLHVKRAAEHMAAWTYVGGSLGAIYAGDYVTLFFFWEMMAFSSVFLIWFRGREQSLGAGYRYLLVHVAGGVALLAGIMLSYQAKRAGGMLPTEAMAFVKMDVAHPTIGTYLIMIGFILNAAVPPLHAWLPDAYSEGTFSGSVFLCAFTTKTAVYALCRGLPGMELLLWLGVIMSLYGVLYAMLQNDARRLLSYHIVSQVGYMVAGVGLGTEMAINGACAHAFAHILYKGLLFMGTGAVLHMTGETRFSSLGGLYKKMPWTFLFTLIGGLSIAAFPLFSGFVSKSMIVTAGFEEHKNWAAFGLMLASSGTFLSIGCKVSYSIWFGKNPCAPDAWRRAADPGWNMMAAMAITSVLCVFIGCYTPYLYDLLPHTVTYHPYTSYHVMETLQLLLFTSLGFFLFIKKFAPKATLSLDLDWPYRKAGQGVLWLARRPVQAIDNWVGNFYSFGGLQSLMGLSRGVGRFDNEMIDGAVDGFAGWFRDLGGWMRALQRGAVQQSLLLAVAVAALLLGGFLFVL